MRVALVFDRLIWGGIERVGITYANMLIANGFDVDVVVLEKNPEDIINELDPKCNIIVKPFNVKYCYENFWPWMIENDKYGLETIAFSLKYCFLNILKPIFKFKYKLKENYDISIAFSGHIKDLTFIADDYIESKSKVAWIHGAQYSYNMISPGFFRLYKRIKNLISISEMSDIDCKYWNEKFNITKTNIYNPCSIDVFNYDNVVVNSLKNKYGDFCLIVGRVDKDKDQELLIDAFYIMKHKYRMDKNLLIVGDGPNLSNLKNKVNKLNLNNNVHFIGTRNDVENFYKAAKIYTHAAPLEGFGMVYIEAMKFGLPVITTDAIPGAREIFENGKYGIITPNGNPNKMADGIIKLYNNEEIYKNYSQKSKLRSDFFDYNKIEKQFIDYLNSL